MKKNFFTSLACVLMGVGIFLSVVCTFADESPISRLQVTGQKVENLCNPIGVGTSIPRLSWSSCSISDISYNKIQSAYQILVASSVKTLQENNGDLWDSGKVISDQSLYVKYAGCPLKSFQHCYWKVRVWDENDVVGPWSTVGTWIQGVIDEKDWSAQWIGQPESVRKDVDLTDSWWITSPTQVETDSGYCTEYFRKNFVFDVSQAEIESQEFTATLYYAACQKFEIFVNGQKVGYSIGMVFNPDQLRAIDVSEYLVAGKNVIALAVSNDTKNPNGTKFGDGTLYPTAIVTKLVVRKLDKSNAPSNLSVPNRFGIPKDVVLAVGSDETWKVTLESSDAWFSLDFDDSTWKNAKVAFEELDKTPWGKLRRRTESVSPCFQKNFELKKPVKNATLAVCAPGLFEAHLNGEKIGDQVLTPAFTRYDRRLLYNVLDLTDDLKKYGNSSIELEFLLGHSWYDVRSIVTWNFDAAPWRDFPRILAQLQLVYEDGTTETIATDQTWTYSTSPVLFDCVRQGEIVDGAWKREILGNVVLVSAPEGVKNMTAQKVAPSKIQREYPAKSVKQVKDGVWVVDMGENNAGWAAIKLHGQKKGDIVRFKYSERIVESGEIERHDIEMHFMEGTPAYMTGMKGEFQTDFYFCNGDDEEVFEPRFTYNGYQFIEILGLREEPKPEDIVGKQINTDICSRSFFNCSNDLLNKIQKATLRSYCNNFVAGYPTDCPHREKNGWMGDAHLACELAQYNFENSAGYEKWIDDVCDEQKENGDVCAIVPTGDWGYPWGNGPSWDSALVLIPWYLYTYRGDIKILEDSYDSIKKYIDYAETREHEDGLLYHGLGDWVFSKTNTPVEVTSTGIYYLDAKILAQIAKLLGKNDDYQKYSILAEKICDAYNSALYKGNGVYSINSQTSESCPIHQGIVQALDKKEQQAVFERLVENVAKADGHFDVGIFGCKYILRTLSEGGRNDLALQLILQDTRPCYADWINRGAGTLWEDWNDGSSRNHIMFGDVSAWFYQSLAGIKLTGAPDVVVASCEPKNVAFKHFVVEPKCSLTECTAPQRETLRQVSACVDSPYGLIGSEWKWNEEKTVLTANVVVPANTTATVILPCEPQQKCEVIEGANFAKPVMSKVNAVAFDVGSGKYSFEISAK